MLHSSQHTRMKVNHARRQLAVTQGAIVASSHAARRQLAEAQARARVAKESAEQPSVTPEQTQQILHELGVHQIELEISNEELRNSQVELELARSLYLDLYDLAPVGYVTLSESGLILQANLKAANILGLAHEGLVNQPLVKFIHPEDLAIFSRHRQQLFATGTTQECELRMLTPDGSWFWARMEACGGQTCRVVLNNISAAKKIEEALIIKSAAFDSAINAQSIGGLDHGIVMVNPAFLRMYGYSSQEEVVGMHIAQFSPNPTEAMALLQTFEATGQFEGELTLKRKDGSLFIGYTQGTVVRNEAGRVIGFQSSTIDITERKLAEAAIQQALAEKTVLLKEVHHRVKNNLAIMVSLINMQVRHIKHPDALAALSDTRARLFAMSLLHEMLYRSGGMDRVEITGYLRQLCANLSESLGMAAQAIDIQSHSVAPVMLAIEQAVPCGLIVSELVSNSIKHAFPVARRGEVSVELEQTAADEILLRVSDNGIGLPDDLQIDQVSSVGLTLVNALTQQLRGTRNIRSDHGTRVEIRFPLQPVSPS